MEGFSTLPGWPLFLRRKDAALYLAMSPSTLDAEVKAGRVPAPVAITPSIKAWHRGDLDAWAESRRAEAAAAADANPWDAE